MELSTTAPNAAQRRGPGSRADARHPTRRELLDTARDVLGREDELDRVTVSRVTGEAGLAKGTFYVHFPDHEAFVVELHRSFHDKVFGEVSEATVGQRPGPYRLRVRFEAFLDGCLRAPGARALLIESRKTAVLREENDSRWDSACQAVATDLSAGGSRALVDERARLLVACVTEVARAELEAGTSVPRMRDALTMLTTWTTGTESEP